MKLEKVFENDMIAVSSATEKEFESDNDIPIIKIGDFDFKLVGFSIIRDNAGDDVLYYKWRHDKKLILYHMTDHPGSGEALNVFILVGKFGGYAVRNIKDYINEIIRTQDEVKKRLKDKRK